MFSTFYKVSTDNLKLYKKYLNITNPFHFNTNNLPGAIYATTAFHFWTQSSLVLLKMGNEFFNEL